MGFLSSWLGGGSSSDPGAGSGASAGGADHQHRPVDTKPNVWRGVFNPGSNPKTKNVGSSYYDNVKDKAKAPTTWEMILQGETNVKRKSFGDLDTNQDGYIDRHELQAAAAGKGLDINTIFAEADTNRDGKIDRKEFTAVLDKYFTARHS